ncbi:BlaI/MecI/CopY family transcriptional regulator [Paenibacillus cellulositrophicus]|jgi:predicted transcriptional regulator|uniref:Transcriptional regulator n=2 Tax=Paenibacillus TaxID=44249 RepID=A0ABQ4L8T7_9BACL|nr:MULTISPECIES: BlaI/MecI/CopY family transcriptional regulator [Paenibacillus]MBJ9991060.1 BlaI/MecI/CopY family transcriptional regulator [Paenibacillus sp. S28]MCM2997208.1 BlaI/MecI/CopY family transcriptional regulator [Paenibacillus cellulositrophicus]MEC0174823.1 BlaI/MecI/CopY family transcriptional regulator [Paenibacillus favisporus]OXL82636.1 transcriptional regulator [Paenibacillus sp. SSG-1]PQP89775.1 transcriptional regulator [Paenibacillus sp. AR247]
MKMNKFNYQGRGLERFFGPLEAKVMDVIWSRLEAVTIKEVNAKISEDKPMSFNTIMTVMNRLVDKGILQKKLQGKSYVYSPVLTKEQFLEEQSKELSYDLVKEFGSRAVAHMIDAMEQVDPDLLDQLEKQIKQWKKDR